MGDILQFPVLQKQVKTKIINPTGVEKPNAFLVDPEHCRIELIKLKSSDNYRELLTTSWGKCECVTTLGILKYPLTILHDDTPIIGTPERL